MGSEAWKYSFSVDLALFKVAEYPKTYKSPDTVKFKMETPILHADPRVIEAKYWLSILTRTMRFSFTNTKRPVDEDPVVVFAPIIKNIRRPRDRVSRISIANIESA